jgi:hypothetical protein
MAETKAERIAAEELNRPDGKETHLLARHKGDPVKLEIAARTSRAVTASTRTCGPASG